MTEPSFPANPEDEYIYISNEGFQNLIQFWDSKNPLKNFNWTIDYKFELPIHLKKKGSGSEPPYTLIEAFQLTVQKIPKNPALSVKRNKKWITWTYSKYYEDVCNYAKGMIALSITPYSAVNIIGFNSPEWSIAFYGSMFGNYLPVGIYTTNNPEACKYVSSHSECEMIIAEDRTQLNKYLLIWSDLPKLKYIILYADSIPDYLPPEKRDKVMTFTQLLELGKKYVPKNPENSLEFRMKQQKPGNCCTLVYTSGTTGIPKAVMLSHDNYTWTAGYMNRFLNVEFGNDSKVSYLPLSHAAGQITDIVQALLSGSHIYFAEATALQGTLIDTLREVRPSYFLGVPRVWEKIEQKMKFSAAQKSSTEKAIENWARNQGLEGTLAEIHNKPVSKSFSLAKKLVYNKFKRNFGLDKTKQFVFGAAPMAIQTIEYFLSLNMFLRNVYGMSESTAPETIINPLNIKKFDYETLASCGSKLEGTELILHNIDKEGNGELCYKGRNRFMGYYKNEEDTKNTIDVNGFLHSGDLGKINEYGNVTITGRIKELIVTSGGENISPVPIENLIKEELPFISNAMIIGDNKKYLVAILTLKLNIDKDGKTTEFLNDDALIILNEIGCDAKTYAEALKDERLSKFIDDAIGRTNKKAISRAQLIRKWSLVKGDFTVSGGELTPTLKLKRKFAALKYADDILKLYHDPKL